MKENSVKSQGYEEDSSMLIASLAAEAKDVDHDHSQFLVKICARIFSFGKRSCCGTVSKSISGMESVKYRPLSLDRSWT